MSATAQAERRRFVRKLARQYRELAIAEGNVLWIYAIQAGERGDIKIGIARDPIKRLKALQVGNAEQLRGLGAWPGTVEFERELHEQYAYARVRGEWFFPDAPLRRLIHDFGGGFCWEPK